VTSRFCLLTLLLLAMTSCAAAPTREPEPVAIAATPPRPPPELPSPDASHGAEGLAEAQDAALPGSSLAGDSFAVRPGNQVALNSARVPFATYLVAMHNRIHPIFADQFLASLSNLPANHPLNDPKLFASVEIRLAGDDGSLARIGVLRSSGVTVFDVAVLDALQRAAPFGKAPDAIRSADGNVYIHWEFHRDPVMSCSTMHARPFILR
jgi:TonB family protein